MNITTEDTQASLDTPPAMNDAVPALDVVASPLTGTPSIHAQAKQGIKLLLGRQVAVQIFTFAGGVVLARTLSPAQVGLYVISTFLVSTFALLGDFGLAASFIQRKEELTERDLQIGFTLQQILITTMVVALLICAPLLARLYPKAPPETVWLVRALAFNLYLTSWRTMSALQLERQLKYDKLAKIEVAEMLTYQSLAVGLAVSGAGVWSYVGATLAAGILGTVLVYGASPWPVRFDYDKDIARGILRFGLPFQLQNIISGIGGWANPLLVGHWIGPQGVGLVTWASSNGKKPLLLTDIVMRVAFPHFSRIQHDPVEVEKIATRYLTFLLLPCGLWFAVLATAGRGLVQLVYTAKWTPAVPVLVITAGALLADVTAWVFMVVLNSQGKVALTTRVTMVRTALTLALSAPLVLRLGFSGVPVAFLISTLVTMPLVLSALKTGVMRRVLLAVAWVTIPTGTALGLGLCCSLFSWPLMIHAIGTAAVSVATFVSVAWLAAPVWVRQSILRAVGAPPIATLFSSIYV